MKSGAKIRLRSVHKSDLNKLFKWINDPELMQFSHTFRPISEPEQEKWYNSLADSNQYFFIIEKLEDNKIIGTCSLHDIDWICRRAEFTIKIGEKSEWGKGYAKEALSCLIDFGFNDLNLQRICLGVFPDNERAVNLYKKLGFQEEGLFKRDYFIKGQYKDVLRMSLLKDILK